MGFQIVWSRAALSELKAIRDYIAADNSQAADGVVMRIHERIDKLAIIPMDFPAYQPMKDEFVRHTVVGRYRIFYRVESEQNRVRILKVWHSSRQEPEL